MNHGALPIPLLFRGKVRDVYAVPRSREGAGANAGARSNSRADAPGGHLLLVASDRVSAFDIVMNEPVPGKGRV